MESVVSVPATPVVGGSRGPEAIVSTASSSLKDRLVGSHGEKQVATGQLILAVFVVTVFLVVPAEYPSATLNQIQPILMNLTNQSFTKHYGYQLGEYALYSLFGFTISVGQAVSVAACVFVPHLTRTFGTKPTLFFLGSALNLIGAICCGLAKSIDSFELFGVGQLFGNGLAWVLLWALAPIYISECSPPHLRGATGVFITAGEHVGNLLAFVLGYCELLGTPTLWPLYVGIPAIFSMFGILFGFLLEESPKTLYLVNGDHLNARLRLQEFYGPNTDIDEVFMQFDAEKVEAHQALGIVELCKRKNLREPLLIGILSTVLMVCCGPVMLSTYLTLIFLKLNFDLKTAQLATICSAVALPVLVYPASVISERFGRRPMLLHCGAMMTALLFVYVVFGEISLHTSTNMPRVSSACGIIAMIALVANCTLAPFGPFSVCFLLAAEILPQRARAAGVSLCSMTQQLAYCVLLAIFPVTLHVFGPLAMLSMILPCIACLVYLWRRTPETRNLHTGQIMRLWDATAADDKDEILSEPANVERYGTFGVIG